MIPTADRLQRCNMLFTVGSDLGSTLSGMFYGIIGSFWALPLGCLWKGNNVGDVVANKGTTSQVVAIAWVLALHG